MVCRMDRVVPSGNIELCMVAVRAIIVIQITTGHQYLSMTAAGAMVPRVRFGNAGQSRVAIITLVLHNDAVAVVLAVIVILEHHDRPLPVTLVSSILGEVDIVENAQLIETAAVAYHIVRGEIMRLRIGTMPGILRRAVVVKLREVTMIGIIAIRLLPTPHGRRGHTGAYSTASVPR